MKAYTVCWHVAILLQLSLGMSVAEAEDPPLTFPQQPVGVVTVMNPPKRDGVNWVYDQDCLEVQRAQGEVTLSTDGFRGLELTAAAAEDLRFLEQLPADSVHALSLNGGQLGQQQLQQISRLSSLQKLTFNQCQFADGAFEASHPPQSLTSLDLSEAPASKMTDRRGLMKWIAAAPEMHTLYYSEGLTAEELRVLKDHPSLESLAVTLGSDAADVLEVVQHLPRLRSLGVRFTPQAKSDAAAALCKLSKLEELRWLFGQANGDQLRLLAAGSPLKRLVLFNVRMGQGFVESLAAFQELQHLELTIADDDQQSEQLSELVRILSGMPRLKNWPRLRSVNASDLMLLTSAKQIERLGFQYVGRDVSNEALLGIRDLPSLRRLELHNITVTDDWLTRLGQLPKLESLQLFATGVTGKAITVESFPALKDLEIWSQEFDGSVVRLNLSSLKELPELQAVSIGGPNFEPSELTPLHECQPLRRLRLWGGGVTDDLTADLLSEMPNLRTLFLADNCVITDVGADALSKSPSLQLVQVSGFLTDAGVAALADTRSLRMLSVSSSQIAAKSASDLSGKYGIPRLLLSAYRGDMVLSKVGNTDVPVRRIPK